MDRIFLDANVLFSAAYAKESGLRRLWTLAGSVVCTSGYAAEEARRNLLHPEQRDRLAQLLQETEVLPEAPTDLPLPDGVELATKDAPILLAAIHTGASHLLTGDLRHFTQLFGHTVSGVRILRPATYLHSLESAP